LGDERTEKKGGGGAENRCLQTGKVAGENRKVERKTALFFKRGENKAEGAQTLQVIQEVRVCRAVLKRSQTISTVYGKTAHTHLFP